METEHAWARTRSRPLRRRLEGCVEAFFAGQSCLMLLTANGSVNLHLGRPVLMPEGQNGTYSS